MMTFLFFALPFGALAAALTWLWLTGDRHLDERTPSEQSFYQGQWR